MVAKPPAEFTVYVDPGMWIAQQVNDERINQLAADAGEKRADPFSVVRWVAENTATEWADIDATTVPDPGAVGLLEFAKSHPDDFRRLYYARLPEHASVTPHRWGNDRSPDSLWAIRERRIRGAR